MARLRVLTWNVHAMPLGKSEDREERVGAIAQMIRAHAPDVVLLQELWLDSNLEYLERALVSVDGDLARPSYLGIRYDSPEICGNALWQVIYKLTAPLGALLPGRKAGLAAFLRDGGQWWLEGSQSLEYCAEISDLNVRRSDGIGDKGAQALALAHTSGARLELVQTHLQSEYGVRSIENQGIRIAQMRELTAWVAERASGRTVVVAGDFNTVPADAPAETDGYDHAAYTELEKLGWKDLTAPGRKRCLRVKPRPSWRCSTHLAEDPEEPENWIDLVLTWELAGPQASLQKLEIFANEAIDHPWSDHHGLLAELDIPEPSPLGPASLALSAALGASASRCTRRSFVAAASAWVAGRGVGAWCR